jgi:precorrin-6B methylase 2
VKLDSSRNLELSAAASTSRRSKTMWTAEEVLALGRSYQGAAVLLAAAELDLFAALSSGPRAAAALAKVLRCDSRGLIILLDALVALQLLKKSSETYGLPAGLASLLAPDGHESVLAMCQHQANCLQRWAQLARVVKSGRPARRTPSVRGSPGDEEAFIGAMHNISAPTAAGVIQAVQPLQFTHLLDVGGASGTWTIAFLQACPDARATLFDLPDVIPMARRRLTDAGLASRVDLVPGDFLQDPLPKGADLAWVSAIVHQNSRAQNRALFQKICVALTPGGRIAIRDLLMDQTRTRPVAGALFAVNMLVGTSGGGTFTFAELREDLVAAGLTRASVRRKDPAMNSVVVAQKPKA